MEPKVTTYNTYLKNTGDKKICRNREANLHRNGWNKITQYDLDEGENAKKSAIETILQHNGGQDCNYNEGVYWIRYDFWAIPHIFVFGRETQEPEPPKEPQKP